MANNRAADVEHHKKAPTEVGAVRLTLALIPVENGDRYPGQPVTLRFLHVLTLLYLHDFNAVI